MQNFAGSSRLPKPQILKPRLIDPYTGMTTQNARPYSTMERQAVAQRQSMPISPLPAPMVRPTEETGLEDEQRRRGIPMIQARAKGGPVKKGEAYLIGERGPELMVPDQNGKVISHAKLKGMMMKNRKKKTNPFYP